MAAGLLRQDHRLIFASAVDTPIDPDNFSHSFSRLCERAGSVIGICTSIGDEVSGHTHLNRAVNAVTGGALEERSARG